MKDWPTSDSNTRVAHMKEKDFYSSETSRTIDRSSDVRVEFVDSDGTTTILKDAVSLLAGEVIDTAVMNVSALRKFFSDTITEAKAEESLLSLHLKATMMKISDPIIILSYQIHQTLENLKKML